MDIDRRKEIVPIKIEKRTSSELSNEELIISFKIMLKEILNGIETREMPIFDSDGNILKYELLSFKEGFKTDTLIKEINELGGDIKLFKMLFSKYLLLLKDDRLKYISINIGTPELLDDKLTEYICTSNSFSERITLEILEDSFGGNGDRIFENVRKYKDSGYSIYLDDFGSGDSNTHRVRDFLVQGLLGEGDGVKLDKEIYDNIESYKDLILDLRSKGINVVGEWVVDEEIFEKLKGVGVNMFQGDYFEKKLEKNR